MDLSLQRSRVEILSIGDEARFAPETLRSDVAWRLLALGLEVGRVTPVAGREPAVEAALRAALEQAAVVITFGGLGGDVDDVVARAAARATGCRLVLHDGERSGAGVLLVPQRAELIRGPAGSGVGFRMSHGGKRLVCLPGPPAEALRMLDADVRPFLEEASGGATARLAILKCAGLSVSEVEAAIAAFAREAQPGAGADGALLVEPIPAFPEVHVRVLARGAGRGGRGEAEAVEARLEAAVAGLRAQLGEAVFGRDAETLEGVVGQRLRARGETLATAESCTGGLLAGRLTEVPGSSAYFERGLVTYSNESKSQLLGVPARLIAARGAVSAEVAEAMAGGIRARAGTTYGVSITGIAGPGGGSPEKPVGTVFIALARPGGVEARRYRFGGGRREIRALSVQEALSWLHRTLKAAG